MSVPEGRPPGNRENRAGGCPSGSVSEIRLLRKVLGTVLVQRGGHLLGRRWDRNRPVQRDFLRGQLLAINALVRVVIGAKRRAFKRNAGKEAAGAGVRK